MDVKSIVKAVLPILIAFALWYMVVKPMLEKQGIGANYETDDFEI